MSIIIEKPTYEELSMERIKLLHELDRAAKIIHRASLFYSVLGELRPDREEILKDCGLIYKNGRLELK